MAAVRHLGFWKFKFFYRLDTEESHFDNHAKFREDEDLSTLCCDIAIFVVFQDGGRRHLDF